MSNQLEKIVAIKHLKSTVFFSIIAVFLCANGVFAQNPTVTIPDIGAAAGKDVNLDIQVSDLSGLRVYSMDFALVYDQSLLQVLDVTSSGAITAPWGNPTVNSTAGQVSVAFAGVDPLSGSGRLIRIRFHVLESATTGSSSPLTFLSFQFNEGQPQAAIQNGSFTVTSDQEAPRIVNGPSITETNYHDVKIFLRTDEPSTVVLLFGETVAYGQMVSDAALNNSHILHLTNLRETTTYHYQVQLKDSLNNGPRISSDYTFRTKEATLNLPALTADPGANVEIPVTIPDFAGLNVTKIVLEVLFDQSQLQVSGINTTDAVLSSWPTPQVVISNGKLTLQAEHATPLQGEGVLFTINGKIPPTAILNQTSNLTWGNVGLNDGQIRLIANNGTLTVQDRLPPLIIVGPEVKDIRSHSAIILWQTNESATSLIDYGESSAYLFHRSKEQFTTEHEFVLTDLNPGTTYHFRVGGKDASGNGPGWSGDATFSTPSTGVSVEFPDTTVTVGTTLWIPLRTSDITAYSVLKWDCIVGYDSQKLEFVGIRQNGSLTQNWEPIQVVANTGFISLAAAGSPPLAGPGSLISLGFQIKNIEQANNQTEIDLLAFRYDDGWPAVTSYDAKINLVGGLDQQPPQILWGPFVDTITNSSARIYWRTNESSTAEIEYGTTFSYGLNAQSSRLDTLHQITLTGLQSGVQYHYHVRNEDAAGNVSPFSADSTFTTLSGNSIAVFLPTLSAAPGATVEIPIQVGNLSGQDVFASDIELAYDETQLTALSVNSSGCLSSVWGDPVYSLFPGQVVIAMGGIQALQGGGDLVKVRFKISDSAQAGNFAIVRFINFVFNEGTPLSSYRSGGVRIQDRNPASLIAGPAALNIQSTSAIIAWQTDEPADSRVYFGITSPDETSIADESLHLSHAILLDGLQPATTYQYRIASRDSVGNDWVSSQVYEFTTQSVSQVSFTIADQNADWNQNVWVPVTLSGSSSRMIFTLDFDLVFAPDVLQFQSFSLTAAGTSDWNSEFQATEDGNVHFHLQGDQPIMQDGELLRFQFLSKEAPYGSTSMLAIQDLLVNGDSSGINVQNGVFQLVDRTPPILLGNPIVSQIRVNSANIAWQTDEPTLGFLVYGRVGETQDTVKILTPATATNYTLTNLQPVTSYQFQVGVVDTSGNGPVWSETAQFTTTAGNEVDVILPDTTLAIGDTVLIPITIGSPGSIPINQYQFTLVFRSDLLELLDVVQTGSLTESWPAPSFSVKNDSLILLHSSSQGISQGGELLFLRLLIRQATKHNQQIVLRFHQFIFNNGAPPAAITNGSILCEDRSAPKFRIPPEIVTVRLKSAVVKIWTDEPSRVKIRYGQTTALDSIREVMELDTLHLIELTNLLPNQTYFYQIEAVDSLENGPTVSEMQSFQTAEAVIHVSIPDTTITIDSDFLLPVRISDVTDFGITRYQLEILYDSQVLTPLGASVDSSLSAAWGNGEFSSDGGKITYLHSGSEVLQGSGVLFWLRFHLSQSAPEGDSTKIQLTQGIFQDGLFPGITKDGIIRFEQGVVPAEVQVSFPDTTVYSNSRFTLGLQVSDVTGLEIQSYSFILYFDHQILELEQISIQNTLTQNWPNPRTSSSGDSLFIDHSSTSALVGEGDLLRFQFQATAGLSGSSKAELNVINFKFNEGVPSANVANGSVTIVERPNQIVGFIKNQRQEQLGIPGAQVVAMDSTNQLVSSTISDSSGYFKLSNLTWNTPYQICAIKSGYSPSDTLKNIFPSHQPVTLYLLKQDGIISGQVVNPEGQPVSEAVITVNDQRGHFGSANSNQDGEFRIENLDRRYRYQLSVTKSGYVSLKLTNIPVDTTLHIELNLEYGKISGQTLDIQNHPLSGVTIKIYFQNTGELVSEMITDVDGKFCQDSLRSGSYLVIAQKAGYLSIPKQRIISLAPVEEKWLEFQLKSYQLATIQITGESFSIPNDSPTQFSYTALSDSGETIDHLENLDWQLLPEEAGKVTDGIVFPDSEYIGSASLILREQNTGIADTSILFIYANILPDRSFQLRDASGMELSIPSQAIDQPFQLKVNFAKPQSIKGSTKDHLVVGEGYDFKPDGIQFLNSILLRLPIPEANRGQELSIGQWDPTRAQWNILPGSRKFGIDKIEVEIEHFSLFALLLPSNPLGIHQVKFTPNPFSPEVDSDGDGVLGVVISFSVSSKTIRQPFVTLRIYSLHGELVRELVINKPLEKGQRHSFNWDGKTDMDRLARNGRYLVQIEVRDEKGTETYLGQVVLIK